MSNSSFSLVSEGLLKLESTTAAMHPPARRGIVFLDRDGVLNELVADRRSGMCESPLEERAVRLIPGAAEALVRLRAAGFLPVCVTNQPAAAKGTVSVAELMAVHARVTELLAAQGGVLATSYMCLHHPLGVVPGLAGACACRKPSPGMLLEAASSLDIDLCDAWMVGDTDADICAGRAVGCKTVLLPYPGSFHKRGRAPGADLTLEDISQAAEVLSSIQTK